MSKTQKDTLDQTHLSCLFNDAHHARLSVECIRWGAYHSGLLSKSDIAILDQSCKIIKQIEKQCEKLNGAPLEVWGPSENAAALGRIRTERKAASSRANIAPVNAARVLLPCNCGMPDGKHKFPCPVYRREAKVKSRAKE